MSKFTELVEAELEHARAKHIPFPTLQHAEGVIREEFEEFWDEVKAQNPSKAKLLAELVSTAASCQRAAEDLGLLE